MERALLTLLAADVGRLITSDRLIDGLWGETPPATAAKALQTYIHHLRSVLPEGLIATKGPGYQLALETSDVDAHRFVLAVTEAREATWEDPETTVGRLGEALSWWRGEPLVDAREADVVRPLKARLEAVRLQAQVDMADAQLRSGSHDQAAVDLHSLLEEHPLREDLWSRYVLALYRSGRQADALRAFDTVRALLIEELGIEPGPELQNLLDRILAQDPTLSPSPSHRPQARPATVIGRPLPPGNRLATLLLVATGSAAALEATRSALARFGGTIVDEDGTRALAVFGAPIAREDDTYRAIRAALAVGETLGPTGEGRCVVSTLPVTLPFETGFGMEEGPLQTMLSDPGPHSVLVDDHTRRLMIDAFDWEESASSGSGVMWRPTAVRRTADKARLGRRLRAPLVGRESEMAQAGHMLESLERGIGGVLVLSGDAGVGKTRIISELRRSPSGIGFTWLLGHCDPYGEATPYWPFRDLIRSWLGLGIDEKDLPSRRTLHNRLEELLDEPAEPMYAYLTRLLGLSLTPDQQTRLSLAPEAIQFRTFEVVAELLTAISERSPTAMVIEDAHWADPTSVELLGNLTSLAESHRILYVVSSRPSPGHVSWRIAEAARHRVPHLITEITLGALGDSDQRAMLSSLLGTADLPEETTGRLLDLSEGNPFYLEELIGSLIDEGALTPSGSGWVFDRDAALTVPETVEKVVQSRIDRLDPSTHMVLTSASVLGRSFGLPLLQGIADERGGVLPAVQDLLRSDLLVEARRWPQAEYLFKHALTREAAYRTLPEGRRRALHRHAAEWLERQFEGNDEEVVELLARHWTAAGVDDRAAPALLRAGDLARGRHALEEAIEHYRQLLPLLEGSGDTPTTTLVLFKLGLAYHTALRFAEANATYQRAFELWSPAPSQEATETLLFAGPAFFDVPDPVRSYALQDIQLQMALFDRLVERWPDDTIVPSLAERWEISDDGLIYRFTLRDGLKWSDGAPLTAHDVEFGLKRNLDPDSPGVSVAMLYVLEGAADHALGRSSDPDLIGVRALDDRVVQFSLNAPAPYFLGMLNRPDCGPQPRHVIEAEPERWCDLDVEVVSGAFRRTEHKANRVVLDRRPDYVGHRLGNVETVVWHTAPVNEVMEGFLDERHDLAWISGPWDGAGSEQIPTDLVNREPTAGLIYFVLNHGRKNMADPRLRLALAQSLDRAALCEGLGEHLIPATGGVVPPALAGHTPDVAPVFDVDLARSLVGQARPDAPIRMAAFDIPHIVYTTLVERAAGQWRRHLGIEVETTTLGPSSQRLREVWEDVDIAPTWWYPGYTDPEYFLRLLLHTEGADNTGRFSSEAFDDLVERARMERDERTRLGLFHQADRLAVAELAAVIPLVYTRNTSLRRPLVEGWWEFGKSWANFADLTLS